MPETPLLDIRNLQVSYGAVTALRGVDLSVAKGEIVTLVGANGAGKSTLLAAASGLMKPASGSIRFEGDEIAGHKAHNLSRRGLILVPEGRRIFVNLSVRENLILGGYFRPKGAEFDQDLERVFSIFPRLAERSKQTAGTLSGGERQMLALGRGLMSSPKLMMLDEPSLGLAPLMVAEVFSVIKRIHAQGVTVLLIEQNAAAALAVAHRGYVMENGQMVLTGTGKELAADGRVQRAYLGMD